MLTPEEAALLIALLFKRAGQKRARISNATIRRLSRRSRIRGAFIDMLVPHLDDLGITMVELDRGGYGLIPSTALDGAPAITAKKHLPDELKQLKQGKLDFDEVRAEVEEEGGAEENDDE